MARADRKQQRGTSEIDASRMCRLIFPNRFTGWATAVLFMIAGLIVAFISEVSHSESVEGLIPMPTC